MSLQQNVSNIDDVLYESPAGSIMVLNVLYGYSKQIEQSGEDFFAHKTGFTHKSLISALTHARFAKIYSGTGNLEIKAIAFKNEPSAENRALFNLPAE